MNIARRWYINSLKVLSTDRDISSYAIAQQYALLGEADEAFIWLERACEERSGYIIDLKIDPTWIDLRSDPRYTAMLKKMGLVK